MTIRTALVDVDDTIAETQRMLVRKISEDTGIDFEFDELNRDYREGDGEHTKVWREAVWAILKQPEVMATVEPDPQALNAITELVENGVRPDIVTARKELLAECTGTWLVEHGFADHIYRRPIRQNGESGVEFKVRVAQEHSYDVAFDDTYDVVIALAEIVPAVYMINKPWNLGHPIPSNVTPVDSFAEGVEDYLHV